MYPRASATSGLMPRSHSGPKGLAPGGQAPGAALKLSGGDIERHHLPRRDAVDVGVELRGVLGELRVGWDDVPAANVPVTVSLVAVGARVADRRGVEPRPERPARLLQRPPLSILPRRRGTLGSRPRSERNRCRV